MYASINKDWFLKNEKEALEESIANLGEEEGKNNLVFPELKDDFTVGEILLEDDGKIHVDLENKLGYFSIEIPIDDELEIALIEQGVKKLNKLKTILEATKKWVFVVFVV